MRPDASRLLGERPLHVALLTSRTPAGERSRLLAGLLAGTVDILVGTHALITDEVRFARLGVVVIDEQHRFGVDQRAALREKGASEVNFAHDPDLLVMTATPIPRTAAMTVYGDLDYSVLDEMPPGQDADSDALDRRARRRGAGSGSGSAPRSKKGHQAFVVCPLIRPGEEDDAARDDEPVLDADDDEAMTLEDLLAESRASTRPPRRRRRSSSASLPASSPASRSGSCTASCRRRRKSA